MIYSIYRIVYTTFFFFLVYRDNLEKLEVDHKPIIVGHPWSTASNYLCDQVIPIFFYIYVDRPRYQ